MQIDPIIIPSSLEHVEAMAPLMREFDKRELWAGSAMLPYEGLLFAYQHSQAFTAIRPDEKTPILMFGISRPRLLDGHRCVWLLGTDQMDHFKKRFVKQSGEILHLLASGDTVYNHVIEGNEVSLKWLKWLGFSIDDPQPHGWLKKKFHFVHKKVESCVPSQPQH